MAQYYTETPSWDDIEQNTNPQLGRDKKPKARPRNKNLPKREELIEVAEKLESLNLKPRKGDEKNHHCLNVAKCDLKCTYIGKASAKTSRYRIWTYYPPNGTQLYCYDSEELVKEYKDHKVMSNEAYYLGSYPDTDKIEGKMFSANAIQHIHAHHDAYVAITTTMAPATKRYESVIDLFKSALYVLMSGLFGQALGSAGTYGGWAKSVYDWAGSMYDAYTPEFLKTIFTKATSAIRFIFNNPILTRIIASIVLLADVFLCIYMNRAELENDLFRKFIEPELVKMLNGFIAGMGTAVEPFLDMFAEAKSFADYMVSPMTFIPLIWNLFTFIFGNLWCLVYSATVGYAHGIYKFTGKIAGAEMGKATAETSAYSWAANVLGTIVGVAATGVAVTVGAPVVLVGGIGGIGAVATGAILSGGGKSMFSGLTSYFGGVAAENVSQGNENTLHTTCPGMGRIESVLAAQTEANEGKDGASATLMDMAYMILGELDLYAIGVMLFSDIFLIIALKLLAPRLNIFRGVPVIGKYFTESSLDTLIVNFRKTTDYVLKLFHSVRTVRIFWNAAVFIVSDIIFCYGPGAKVFKPGDNWKDHCCYRKLKSIIALVDVAKQGAASKKEGDEEELYKNIPGAFGSNKPKHRDEF